MVLVNPRFRYDGKVRPMVNPSGLEKAVYVWTQVYWWVREKCGR